MKQKIKTLLFKSSLLGAFLFSVPYILSTAPGHNTVFWVIKQVYGLDLRVDQIHLKWFGPQSIKKLSLNDLKSKKELYLEEVECHSSIFTLLKQNWDIHFPIREKISHKSPKTSKFLIKNGSFSIGNTFKFTDLQLSYDLFRQELLFFQVSTENNNLKGFSSFFLDQDPQTSDYILKSSFKNFPLEIFYLLGDKGEKIVSFLGPYLNGELNISLKESEVKGKVDLKTPYIHTSLILDGNANELRIKPGSTFQYEVPKSIFSSHLPFLKTSSSLSLKGYPEGVFSLSKEKILDSKIELDLSPLSFEIASFPFDTETIKILLNVNNEECHFHVNGHFKDNPFIKNKETLSIQGSFNRMTKKGVLETFKIPLLSAKEMTFSFEQGFKIENKLSFSSLIPAFSTHSIHLTTPLYINGWINDFEYQKDGNNLQYDIQLRSSSLDSHAISLNNLIVSLKKKTHLIDYKLKSSECESELKGLVENDLFKIDSWWVKGKWPSFYVEKFIGIESLKVVDKLIDADLQLSKGTIHLSEKKCLEYPDTIDISIKPLQLKIKEIPFTFQKIEGKASQKRDQRSYHFELSSLFNQDQSEGFLKSKGSFIFDDFPTFDHVSFKASRFPFICLDKEIFFSSLSDSIGDLEGELSEKNGKWHIHNLHFKGNEWDLKTKGYASKDFKKGILNDFYMTLSPSYLNPILSFLKTPFELGKNGVLDLTMHQAEWEQKDKVLFIPKLSCEAKVKQTIKSPDDTDLHLSFYSSLEKKEDTLDFVISADTESQTSVKGQLNSKGEISKNPQTGNWEPQKVTLHVQKFPMIVWQELIPHSPFSIFGHILDGKMLFIPEAKGHSLDVQIDLDHLHLSGLAHVDENLFYMKKPLLVEMIWQKDLNSYIKERIPSFPTITLSGENPIKLSIPQESVLSLRNKNEIKVSQASFEIPPMTLESDSFILNAFSFLDNQNGQYFIWPQTLNFDVTGDKLFLNRTDFLINKLYEMALWGSTSFENKKLQLILGVPSQSLEKAFHLKDLPKEYMLHIPLKGTWQDPTINKKSLTTKIAILMAKHQTLINKKITELSPLSHLEKIVPLPDQNKKSPSPRKPYPWEPSSLSTNG
ncbi:MAG: hypothetical protein ACOVOR_02295 [Rhabdochlamydiaceae bacterium]